MEYDHYIVSFSGGKDSMACLLYLLELGVPRDRIELWHMLVDGREDGHFMDWPITESYCRAVAAHFDLPIYMSWKVGGFKRELLRSNEPTAPTKFERDDGTVGTTGGKGPNGTRGKFPQVSADLKVRWCSAYLKIDVCTRAIQNQERFTGKRTVIVTGERGEESSGRAKYAIEEPDRSDLRTGRSPRYVDHWRPVRDWPEAEVWAIMQRWKVRPHPAYQLGFGRVSCALCIFGNANQWASARLLVPRQFVHVALHEEASGFTIKRRGTVQELAEAGTPYEAINTNRANRQLAMMVSTTTFTLPIPMDPWELPAGAYGEACGPT